MAGCADRPPAPAPVATPIAVPTEGRRGEYTTVVLGVNGTQPTVLYLSRSYKTDVDNYLGHTNRVYPDNTGKVTLHERVPPDIVPGDYLLRVLQLQSDDDTTGVECSRVISPYSRSAVRDRGLAARHPIPLASTVRA